MNEKKLDSTAALILIGMGSFIGIALVAYETRRTNQLLAVIAKNQDDLGALIDIKTDALEAAINGITGLE